MLQLFIGLATALTGGVVAAFVTYRLNATKEHIFHMRRKAEELFLAFDKYDKEIGIHFIGYIPLMKEEIDYNQALDLQIERGAKEADAASNFKMLSSIYFPGIAGEVTEFETALDQVNQVISRHKAAYKRGDGSGHLPEFMGKVRAFGSASNALRAAIIREGRDLMSTESLWPDVKRLQAAISERTARLKGKQSSQ